MHKTNHICKFEKEKRTLRPTLSSPELISIVIFFQYLFMLCKRQKKVDVVLQCERCRKYAFECPYCHTWIETLKNPIKMPCPNCGKIFVIRWWYI